MGLSILSALILGYSAYKIFIRGGIANIWTAILLLGLAGAFVLSADHWRKTNDEFPLFIVCMMTIFFLVSYAVIIKELPFPLPFQIPLSIIIALIAFEHYRTYP